MSAAHRPRLFGTNLERAADHNQRITLHAIRVCGALTRVELASITGLTTAAIANITRRLLNDGLIEEAGQQRGGRGQPPTRLVIRHKACFALGINIDRDHVTIVLVDFAGETVARISEDIAFALPGQVATLYRTSIRKMLQAARITVDQLVGLGVASPDQLGSIDLPGRPAAYADWDEVDMAKLFARPFALPVFTENDAAAAAMGEMQFGLGQRHASFFYILISSGLGGGVVVDNAYIRGADGRSGELGFLRTATGAQVQTLVSRSGLAMHLNRDGFALADIPCDNDTGGHAVQDSVEAWIEAAATQLVEPLTAVNCLLNPAIVLVGGRLPAAVLDGLTNRLNTRLAEACDGIPALAPVARAALSADAPAVGAVILPFSHFLLPKPGALWKTPGHDQ